MTSQIDPTHPAEGQAMTAAVRNNFAAAYNEISDLQGRVGVLEGDESDYSQDISDLQAQVAALTATVNDQATVITALQVNVQNLNQEIAALQTTVNDQATTITALQTNDSTQDTMISDLQTNDSTQDTTISDLQTNVTGLQTNVMGLQANVTDLQTDVQDIDDEIVVIKARQMAAMSQTSDDPPNTSSSTFVTAGLNIVFTPSGSTRGLFTAEGSLGNGSNNATSQLQMIYGAGTPPNAGTDITQTNGTLVGAPVAITTTKAGESRPFSVTAVITGLTPQSAYWIGAAFCAVSGGTAQLSEVTITAFELLDPLP